jgi:excisionase family DNA binding protein
MVQSGERRLRMDTFYTVKEVAERLRVSTATVRKLVKDGELGAYIVGSQWRISEIAIQDYCKNNTFTEELAENA